MSDYAEKVKRYYAGNRWPRSAVDKARENGWITEDEYEEILASKPSGGAPGTQNQGV